MIAITSCTVMRPFSFSAQMCRCVLLRLCGMVAACWQQKMSWGDAPMHYHFNSTLYLLFSPRNDIMNHINACDSCCRFMRHLCSLDCRLNSSCFDTAAQTYYFAFEFELILGLFECFVGVFIAFCCCMAACRCMDWERRGDVWAMRAPAFPKFDLWAQFGAHV